MKTFTLVDDFCAVRPIDVYKRSAQRSGFCRSGDFQTASARPIAVGSIAPLVAVMAGR